MKVLLLNGGGEGGKEIQRMKHTNFEFNFKFYYPMRRKVLRAALIFLEFKLQNL
jgi:hypothetical protein